MDSHGEKILQLERENCALRERLELLEKTRHPLGQLPTPQAPAPQGCPSPCCGADAPSTASGMRVEDAASVLHYLKTILGFSIKQNKNTLVLRSVYAFCEEDVFEVEVADNKLVLKQTDYLNEWPEYINTYIKGGRSYSAFFAAVTLNLFNKKTFG
ncbi:hypothetical protein PAPHI01_1939 [Pancytospora philotis]|nr:hypothetical protein PAPHI01_1939 [Pancytospora philotis]